MACGKIVIATRVGSLSEIIMDGHNGILVNPNDLNSLTDGLRKAISSLEQKNEMGLNASKYVINNYSPSSVSHILLGLYRELQH
jgi:glycosyltransferase involved in cell wall biosynthesis